jgi:hypothetical protein
MLYVKNDREDVYTNGKKSFHRDTVYTSSHVPLLFRAVYLNINIPEHGSTASSTSKDPWHVYF